MFDENVLEAMMACFRMFPFGPAWEEALCMFKQNGLEAMLACFGMFRFGPTWEEALCMFEQNGLEAMLACFGMFCFGMCWKRCWHVYVPEAMLACFVRFRPGTILILRGRRARGCRTGMALCTAGFAQCVCQGFTNCRFLMVFLCCQAGPRCWSPWATCKPGA